MYYYVFGYGSLMDPVSAAATLGYAPHIITATLSGYRTAWNVAAQVDEGPHLGRYAVALDGARYEGLIVPIGLEAGKNYLTHGVIFRVTKSDMQQLDLREINYDRVDVTDSIKLRDTTELVEPHTVYTYVPKKESIAILDTAAKAGIQAVVMKSYLDLLHHAAQYYPDDQRPVVPIPQWQVKDIAFQE